MQVNLNITNTLSWRWGLRHAMCVRPVSEGCLCGLWEALHIQLTNGAFQIQIERWPCQTTMPCIYEGSDCERHSFSTSLDHLQLLRCDHLTYSDGNSKWFDLIPYTLSTVCILYHDHMLALVMWENRQNKDMGGNAVTDRGPLIQWHPA